LPYVLADAGFDVWVGTFRGFPLSSGHVNLTQADSNYWDYSQDEIGFYDIPAFIDYILRVTGRSNLYFIGYSYGVMVGYIALADRPEYMKKIRKMVNIAPTIVTTNIKYLHLLLPAFFTGLIGDERLGKPRQALNILPYSRPCNKQPDPKQLACRTLMGNLIGFLTGPLYEDRVAYREVTMHRSGISTKMLLHFFQQLRTHKFAHYDYGSRVNRKHYGSKRAPLYNISRVTVPAMTIYSDGDGYAPPEDVQTFLDSLSAAGRGPVIRIRDPNFQHFDFAARREARVLVYEPIVKYFRHSRKL
jgi:lysosomal acid lipase/cholesteryl ester hydrolase